MTGILQALLASVSAAVSAVTDEYFEYVTMLLPGNGTNGAQNNTFLDSSTNNFTITRNGNTTQGTFSPYGDNWSNYFVRASSSYITFADNSAFNLSNSNFTIECFIFCTLSGSTQDIAGQADSSITTTSRSFLFQINGSGNIVAGVWSGTTGYTVTSSSTFAFNAWHHVALVRDGSTITLYVNGTSQGTSNISTASVNDSSNNLSIGRFGERNTAYYDGYVSNFRMVVGTAVYTAAFTPPTAPLTAITNTSLLTCQSNRFIDNSTNAFAITRNGDVSVQRFSPFSPTAAYASGTIGGSGYFDGTGDYLTLSGNTNLALGSGNFTIELWVNITSFTTYGTFATTYNNTPVAGTWFLRLNASTQQWQWQNGSDGGAPNFKAYNSSTNLIAGAWHHLAVVRSSGVVTLYQDGVNVGGGTDVETLVAPTFWIGQTINGYPMNGYISNLRVLKGTAQYTAAFTPPTAPLTAITNTQLLTNFTNAGIIDNAMMNDLETVGNAQISTTQSKFGGGSMSFDGTGDWLLAPNSANLAFNTGDFTIECWVYPTASPSYACIIDTRNGFGTGGFGLFITSGTGLQIFTSIGVTIFTGTSCITTNTWQHVVVCRSGTSLRVFVNGTQIGSTVTNSANMSDGYLIIGNALAADRNYPLTGYIDDLRITKGVARYTANFTAPTAPFPTQ